MKDEWKGFLEKAKFLAKTTKAIYLKRRREIIDFTAAGDVARSYNEIRATCSN